MAPLFLETRELRPGQQLLGRGTAAHFGDESLTEVTEQPGGDVAWGQHFLSSASQAGGLKLKLSGFTMVSPGGMQEPFSMGIALCRGIPGPSGTLQFVSWQWHGTRFRAIRFREIRFKGNQPPAGARQHAALSPSLGFPVTWLLQPEAAPRTWPQGVWLSHHPPPPGTPAASRGAQMLTEERVPR